MFIFRPIGIWHVGFYLAQFFYLTALHATADFIIMSYDRPMQLYALLESTEKYIKGIDATTVIYRTSDEQFARAYSVVQATFPAVHFVRQGANPAADFKPLLLEAIAQGKAPHILFAPDDIIVKNHADLAICAQAMDMHNAYAFFLRLGTHLDTCYATSRPQPLPPLTIVAPNIYAWRFKDNESTCNWRYPNNVDMTLYRKQDILDTLQKLSYTNPNRMEADWAECTGMLNGSYGLCYADSIIVNIPVNRVQNVFPNNNMNAWTTAQLLELFEAGKKIDIQKLAGIKNKSCHMEYDLTFITR